MNYRSAALLIMFLAFLLRIYRLDAVGLEGDEAFSIKAAYSGVSSIIHLVSTAEPHPPLYYSSLHVWYLLTGTSEFALRFPSLLANVLTIAFLLKLADLFSWRSAGLVGAMLLTLNPYQVWYSQEARMYTPAALFGLAAIYFSLRFLRQGRTLQLGLYSAFVLLSMYSHYYAIFLFVFTNVILLSGMWHYKKLGGPAYRWIGGQVIVAALYFPWLVFASRISLSYTPFKRGTVDLLAIVKDALANYSLGLSMPPDTGFTLSLGFLVVVIAGLWFAGRSGGSHPAWLRCAFASGYLLAPIALGFLVSLLRPMFAARYFMVSSPAFFLVLGLGVVGLYRRARLLGIAAGLFLASAQAYSLYNHYYDYQYVKTDYPDAVAYIQRHTRPGDAIVLDGWSQTFQFWYYHTLRAKEPVPSYLFPLGEANGWELTPGKIDEIMARHQGVWLLDYDVLANDPRRRVETYLAKNYYQALYQPVGLNRVVYYASPPAAAPLATPLNISCNQEILLESFDSPPTSVRPGEVLPLAMSWRATSEKRRDYAVSWRLLDETGRIVLQRDAEPASGFYPSSTWPAGAEVTDRYAMPVPAYLPPGKYSLAIVPYDQASKADCELRQGDKTLPPGAIPLTRLEVLDVPPVAPIDEPKLPHMARFSVDDLNLLGFDVHGGSVRPGDAITVKLFWQAIKNPGRDYEVIARLLSDKGEVVQEKKVGLGPPWFPTSRWQSGRTVVTYLDVTVPPRAPTGAHTLALSLTASGVGDKVFSDLPRVRVVSRERNFTTPPIAYAKAANYGGLIELLGYDLQPAPNQGLAAGQEIDLKLYWRALKEVADNYKVFTQLLGEDQKIYGQHDSVPLDGKAPTNGWVQGEVLEDNYKIVVRPGAPVGKYKLIVGFYESEKGSRIPLADGSGDAFVVANLEIPGGQR